MAGLWSDAGRWMGLGPPATTQLLAFVNALQSGERLCVLLNKARPRAVPVLHPNPRHQVPFTLADKRVASGLFDRHADRHAANSRGRLFVIRRKYLCICGQPHDRCYLRSPYSLVHCVSDSESFALPSSPCPHARVQFQKLQNINACISALTSYFGLHGRDVFDAEDVYYGAHFENVVHTLSLLSHHRRFIDLGMMYVESGLHDHHSNNRVSWFAFSFQLVAFSFPAHIS